MIDIGMFKKIKKLKILRSMLIMINLKDFGQDLKTNIMIVMMIYQALESEGHLNKWQKNLKSI
jgi:hypothetical protein